MFEGKLPGRRDFLKIAAGTFVVASVPVALRSRSKLVHRSVPAMGATAEIAVIHRDERYAYAAMDAALAEIQRIEALMTRFSVTSDIGRANLHAARSAVQISRETARVIATGVEWAQATNGAFDPAVAQIIDLWDVAHRTAPPAPPLVTRLANRNLYRHLDVDPQRGVVRFAEQDVVLDLGGIAAGYSVDRAAQVLRDWGIHNGFINVSGDIYALGNNEAGDPWTVGVRSPTDPGAIIATAEISDAAIATSGDYEQFFLYQGRRYHHIMDPHTAAPRETRVHTITIQAADCLTCDVASTALFGMEAAQAARVLRARTPSATVVA